MSTLDELTQRWCFGGTILTKSILSKTSRSVTLSITNVTWIFLKLRFLLMDVLFILMHKFHPRGCVKNNYLQEVCTEARAVCCDTK
jgi:hypothetical protein